MNSYLAFVSRFAALATVAALSLRAAEPTPYNHTDPRLVYDASRSQDFFTSSVVDTGKWAVNGPNAAGLSADDPANVAISGGALAITGHAIDLGSGTPVKGCYFTGGSLYTKRLCGYGYYEIHAQMPTGDGWLAICDSASAASNAITLASFNTANTFTVTQAAGYNCVYNGLRGYPVGKYRYSQFTLATLPNNLDPVQPKAGFNYYGLEWTPQELIWYVNGVEEYRVTYPGPHSPIAIKLSLKARSVASGASADGVEFKIKHFRHWAKEHDVLRRDASLVAAPTDLVPHYPENGLAFNHQVFDWDAMAKQYTRRPGSTVGMPYPVVASNDPANPIHPYYSTGDLAKWSYNGTAAAAEVFAWNPATYPTAYLQGEYGALPSANHALFSIVGNGSTVSATRTVDQVYGGQRWAWLGLHAFTPGSGYVKVAAQSWSPEIGIRAAAMQFRQLDYFYDEFGGGGGGWTVSGGTWAVGSGVLAQNGTGPTGTAFYLRNVAAPWADCFVRAQVKFAGASPAANVGLVGRLQTTNTYYLLRLVKPATPGTAATLDLLRLDSGVVTTLASVQLESAIDPIVNFVDLHLFMLGGRLQALADGALVIDVTDASPLTAAGQAGVRTYGGTAQFDRAGAGQ